MKPLFDGQVDRIVDLVQAEIEGHTTAVGTGTSASPAAPPDPRVVPSVGTITAKMKELKDAKDAAIPDAKITGAAGDGPTPVNVSYTIGGLMGGGGTGVRADYMQGIADLFNRNLKKSEEDDFTAGPNTAVAPGPSPAGGGAPPAPAPTP